MGSTKVTVALIKLGTVIAPCPTMLTARNFSYNFRKNQAKRPESFGIEKVR
jgi:hypothetical protein